MHDPVEYVKQHTNPEMVVSGVVTALAVGLVVMAFRNSGIAPLKAAAGAVK